MFISHADWPVGICAPLVHHNYTIIVLSDDIVLTVWAQSRLETFKIKSLVNFGLGIFLYEMFSSDKWFNIIVYLLPSNKTTLIKCPGYRMTSYHCYCNQDIWSNLLCLTVINKQFYFTYAQRDGHYEKMTHGLQKW